MQTRTFFSIEETDERYPTIRYYVLNWARNPDIGSEFDERTKELRKLPDSELLRILRGMNYDMFLGYEDNVIGHLALQRHNDGLHIFSVSTASEYRSNPRAVMDLVSYFLEYLKNSDERRFRLSAGNNRSMKTLLRILARCEDMLGIHIGENYWVEVKE
ncbi:hypothetical protein HYV88_02070 [Candidatus Woesearchaeota archaeon]|nr:hypothetical protein [Candidatus Woesearchaeota archaeon]